jgi:hypothetical protein
MRMPEEVSFSFVYTRRGGLAQEKTRVWRDINTDGAARNPILENYAVSMMTVVLKKG